MTDATRTIVGVSRYCRILATLPLPPLPNERINKRKSPGRLLGVQRRDRRSSPKKEPRKRQKRPLRRRKPLEGEDKEREKART